MVLDPLLHVSNLQEKTATGTWTAVAFGGNTVTFSRITGKFEIGSPSRLKMRSAIPSNVEAAPLMFAGHVISHLGRIHALFEYRHEILVALAETIAIGDLVRWTVEVCCDR
jgi:hypothetical protein